MNSGPSILFFVLNTRTKYKMMNGKQKTVEYSKFHSLIIQEKSGDHDLWSPGYLVGVSGFEPEASWTRTAWLIFHLVSFGGK